MANAEPVILEALAHVVVPALDGVFHADEIERVSVDLHGDGDTLSLALTLTVCGETLHERIWDAAFSHLTWHEWRERLSGRIDAFVAESSFGWGKLTRLIAADQPA